MLFFRYQFPLLRHKNIFNIIDIYINKYQLYKKDMDARISVSTQQEGSGFFVAQFKTAELAVFSYYIESQGESLIIDPTFDIKIYQDFIIKRNTTLKYVLLTHYHADFLSGHTQFNVPIIMGKNSKKAVNTFEVHQYEDNSHLTLGNVKINTLHTPGHTMESTCFLLHDSNGQQSCLFSGDTVFLGDVGRPDLAVKQQLTKQDLAGFLFDSIQKLKSLNDSIRLYPGHGSGSSCGKAISAGNFCTLQNQKANNYGFQKTQKSQFIKQIINISAPPKYFAYDSELNQKGPSSYEEALKASNIPLSVEEFKIESKTKVVIDTRNDIGQGLIKGVFWLPSKGGITTWLTNLLSPQKQYILFCDNGKWQEIADRFFRIGYFNLRGYNNFSISDWKEELNKPTLVNFQSLKQLKDIVHLDVRNQPQFQSLGIIKDSILIPLPNLPQRWHELQGRQNLVINCRSGLRARVAYSILINHGINTIVFTQSFDKFKQNGLNIIPNNQK